MVRTFSMLILLLFISCNNSNGQELREARKKSEKKSEMAEVKSLDYKSCTELRKFNVNAEKIELKNWRRNEPYPPHRPPRTGAPVTCAQPRFRLTQPGHFP